ncbi:MAG: hypothetical protein QGG96_00370 [Candidatus Poseidoniaceae archaeon]|jgi:hypothetical protein|nr:hypothetical protein [Candidatus Poseidoniaceae archaeon]
MDLSWEDIAWQDPDGGTIVLHGTLPTVVYPNAMRPRIQWHGLGLLCTAEEPEIWIEEEKAEAEDSGINLDSVMLNGGIDGLFAEMMTYVDDLQTGRFPDPEPRRLHRAALTHERPIFFAEPEMDDEDWADHLEKEAKEVTKWRKLLGMVFIGKKWRKRLKKMRKHVVEQPSRQPDGLQAASALVGAWWSLLQARSTEKLNTKRDTRFSARLRGGLANLRDEFGDDAILLVPVFQPWRQAIHQALESGVEAEEVSSPSPSSEGEEE